MDDIVVAKCDAKGHEAIRYPGTVLERGNTHIMVEARFGLRDLMVHDVPFNYGDRFVETYFTDKWFNIHEVYDKDDDHLKAWYCNVSCPAEIEDGVVKFRDLALDLLVYPDGQQLVLDRNEFEALELSNEVRKHALEGLANLQALFRKRFAK
jgi:uncharacterized protein